MQHNPMQHNLAEQIEWLSNNLADSQLKGFQYAPTVSKDIEKPVRFSFDNQRRLNSRNAALSSVGTFAHMELEMYRKNDMRQSDEHRRDDSLRSVSNQQMKAETKTTSSNYTIPDSVFMDIDIDGRYLKLLTLTDGDSNAVSFFAALVNEELNKSMKASSQSNVAAPEGSASNTRETVDNDSAARAPSTTSSSHASMSVVATSTNYNPSFLRAETTPRPYEQTNSISTHQATRSYSVPAAAVVDAVSVAASAAARRVQEIQGQMSQ